MGDMCMSVSMCAQAYVVNISLAALQASQPNKNGEA